MHFTPGHFLRMPEWRIRLTEVGYSKRLRDETSSSCANKYCGNGLINFIRFPLDVFQDLGHKI